MEMVCWQCGDIGFKDFLVYCTRCRSAPRHSYCMDEVPDNFMAVIDWICEDCKINSPNSTNIAKVSKTSSIPGHSSETDVIGTNDPCQGICFVNDHLVNPQDQLLISNLRIDLDLNMDKNVSYEKKIETLSCRTSAPGTITPSSCFKLNEVRMEVSGNEKSERVSLTLQNKDRLDKSQSFVDARSTDNQFAEKMLTVNSVETSNKQTIELMSNCGSLGASRLSPFFAQNKDDIQEFGKWKLKKRRSKRSLILPSKDKLDSFNPLLDGKSANISLAVKRTLGTVNPFSCIKLNEDGMGECGNEKQEIKSLMLLEMDKEDKYISLADLQGTELASKKRLSVTSVEASNIQITKLTSDFDFGGLGAGRLSSCPGLKEDELEESDKELKNRRLVLPSNEELDTRNPLVSCKVTNSSLAVKRVPGIEQLGREKIGRTISCANHTNGAVRSSGCKQKEYKIDMNGMINSKCRKLVQPIKDECCNFHPLIDSLNTNISHTGKKSPVSSVEPSARLAMGRTSEVKSSVCFGKLIPPAKEPFYEKTLKSNSSRGAEAHFNEKSSTCFDLKQGQLEEQGKEKPMIRKLITAGMNAADDIHPPVEAKIDRNGKEKLESGRLILDTNDHLNSSHLVVNRRGASINLADKSLNATSVVASDRQTEVKDQMKFPCQQTSQSMPVVSHVWRGTFNINKREFGPFRAHLSNKACEKVCNLARKLPLVLHMQKLPRFAAWPNSFKVSSPTDDNIALYFSPESHRVEIVLDGLVDDIINNDLVLKCHFDEVELLVFSSFLLPREHQRLYGKYYAWGVFKPRSSQACSVPAGFHAVPNGVAEENQVDNSLKPARNEVKDHTDISLKDSVQKIIEYNFCLSLVQTREGAVMVSTDSTAACDKEKGRADNCAPSVCEVEGQKKLSHVNHGRSISKNLTFELKEAAEEGIERVDMARLKVRSNIFRGGIEHQLEPKKPGNMLQYAEEKQNSPGSSISRKRHNSSGEIEGGEISDFDNSSITDPYTEQQSALEQSAEDEQLGERILSIKMSIDLPKLLPGIEAGEVCDDGCFDDSRNCEPTYLNLFPLHMENMGKAVKLKATKGISELNLEFDLPSFDVHDDA